MFTTQERAVFALMDACLRDGWCPGCLVVNVARLTHHIQKHSVKRRWIRQGKTISIAKITRK